MPACFALYPALCMAACLYDDLSTPPGSTGVGSNCGSGESTNEGSSCDITAQGYTCSSVTCGAGGWDQQAPCLGDACSNGVMTAATGADYTACDQKVSGEYCDPSCLSGYKKVGGSVFSLTCVANTYSDSSNVVCLPVCATLSDQGPTHDESSCAGLVQGSTCRVTCATGYTGGTALYVCSTGGTEPSISPGQSNPVCNPSTCTSPLVPGAAVNYTQCIQLTTGSTCTPTCDAGYSQGIGSSFTLLCDVNGVFVDSSNLQCHPNTCALGPTTPTPHGDYTGCNGLSSGGTCTPSCLAGYFSTTISAFNLTCTADRYADDSGMVCQLADTCLAARNPDPNADYTPCSGLLEGSDCTPTCADGYARTNTPFMLLCDGGGAYDDPGRCVALGCTGGAANPASYLDYTRCLSLRSGDVCEPVCAAGYERTGGMGFTLRCTGDQFTDFSNTVCAKANCTAPMSPVPLGDYGSCNGLQTSDTCSPSCAEGYTVATVTPFEMTCDVATGVYVDTSGLACTGLPCHGGAVSPATDVVYTPCIGKVSGDVCEPDCAVGYTAGSQTPFTLLCVNGNFVDKSSTTCVPSACTLGPGSPEANVNYTSCMSSMTGDMCLPQCRAGYTSSGSVVPFKLVCSSGKFASDTSGIMCAKGVCTGGAITTAPNADYSSCLAKTSGDICDPTCELGYAISGISNAFELICSSLQFADESSITCTPESCTGGPTNPNSLVNYTTCSSQSTGTTCNPECIVGYVPTAGMPYTLTCVGERYADTSGATCQPTPCSSPTNPSPNADYSSCVGLATGELCNPTCNAGFAKAAGQGFAVDCGPTGEYTDSSTVVCEGNPCGGGPSVPTSVVNYMSCNAKVSGDACTPTCPDGYDISSGGAFVLTCVGGEYDDLSNVSCTPAACEGVGNPRLNVNYTSCDNLTSGSVCTPRCVRGYRVASQTTNMAVTCTRGDRSYEDTSTTICTAATCKNGPVAAAPNAVYSTCDTQNTGGVCAPACADGYAASTFAPFILTCDQDTYLDLSGIACTPQLCAQGPTNPSPHADYSSCLAGTTGGTCTPVCTQGTAPTVNATSFVLSCSGTFIDTSGIVCTPNPCDLGPTTPSSRVEYSSCNSKQTGGVCTPTCAAGTTPIGGASFTLTCANGTYVDLSGLTCSSFTGECVQHSAVCTSVGQDCVDPTTAANDWTCVCAAPYTGTPTTMGVASCVLHECQAVCPTCGVCPAGQTCKDSDTSITSKGDWSCTCDVPAVGSAMAAAAVCVLDECTQANYKSVCMNVGQECHDPDDTTPGDWTCRCVAPATGTATSGPAACTYPGECATNSVTCTVAGQTCVDPSDTVLGDWQCVCVLPETGQPAVGMAAACVVDECVPNPCGQRQTCIDSDRTASSLGDYVCSCPPPLASQAIGASATCSEDECIVYASVCSDAGQMCVDANKLVYNDWECRCAGSGTGTAVISVAVCSYTDECSTKFHICTSQGQFCSDPDPAVPNDWTCNCMDTALGHAMGQAATCELDECTASCPTCANTTCSAASQACVDVQKGSSTLSDWRCECQPPFTGSALTAVASCEIDECIANGHVCTAAGQLCEDVDKSVTSMDTWQCACKPPKVGAVLGGPADCRFSGECVANHKVCTDVGQMCIDPSDTTLGDWACECIAPQTGANSTGAPAACVIDECQGSVCGSGQTCTDPNASPSSLGDYICNCTVGTGTAVGGAAACVLDECLDESNMITCVLAGQECFDLSTAASDTGDWMCRCTHGVSGEARARAATCNYEGECILQHTTCALGETCVDPDLATTSDWSCMGGAFDECTFHNISCAQANQTCLDPDPRVASLGDWQCVCTLPFTGTATATPATCDMDECASVGTMCSQKAQVCYDPNHSELSLDDWQCECTPPASGQPGIGSFANCALDECSANAICSQAGQVCADPIPDPMHLDDWQCSCGPDSIGMPAVAAPAVCQALCVPNMQQGYTSSCPSAGVSCLASEVLLVCDSGFAGTAPSAACPVPGDFFIYTGCTDSCSQIACAAPAPCQEAGVCQTGSGCTYAMRVGACDDGSVLTTDDQCINGVCTGEAQCGPSKCKSTNDCQTAACVNEACVLLPRLDGTVCNNTGLPGVCQSSACTDVDLCSAPCAAKDQCHEAGACDPWSGVCTEPLLGDGTPCDDGNPLTDSDTCVGGVCVGRVGCAGSVCTAPQCNVPLCENNNCSSTPAPDGAQCDDGNALTLDDACLSGQCVGGDRCAGVMCPSASGCLEAGVCSPVTGQCTQAAAPDNTTCDDAQPLTYNDVCMNGGCSALCKGTVCPSASQCRLAAQCDGHTGMCHANKFVDGTPCDDGDPLTTDDLCMDGECTGRSACHGVVCTALNTCREPGQCNATTGKCDNPMKPDGSYCDDSDSSTVQDQCVHGFCRGLKLCSNGICAVPAQCKEVECGTNGECLEVSKPDGEICDDGDAATDDSCQQGVCVGCPVCLPSNQCHESAHCNIKTGACVEIRKPDGSVCDDSDASTIYDKCRMGVCVGEPACGGVQCTATTEQCMETACINSSCTVVPGSDGASCQDGNYHTTNDTCTAGVCLGVAPCADVFCAPTDQCHGPGVCDPDTELCTGPVLNNGVPCDDGITTTHADQCVSGVCIGISKCTGVTCTPYSECHQAGSCDPTTGLCTGPVMPNGQPCSSGEGECHNGLCRRVSTCGGVQCVQLADPCKQHECANGCVVRDVADGAACYDGLPHTLDDHCVKGSCVGSDKCAGVVCAPSGQCTGAGVCEPRTGVCSTPAKADGSLCNDANPLTVNDKCKAGQCAGHSKCLSVVCHASDGCHEPGVCDEVTGLCSDPPVHDGTQCDDGLAETTDDRCTGGVCAGTVNCGGVVCSVTDPRCGRAVCDSSNRCVQAAKTDGTKCNDHQPTTLDDKCVSGLCAGRNPCDGVLCPVPSDPCLQSGGCLLGQCTDNVASFSRPCDDGDDATDADTCYAGVCLGQPKCLHVVCPEETQCLYASTCVPETGLCGTNVKPNGTACDDGDAGTHGDVCAGGVCGGVVAAVSVVRVQVQVDVARGEVESKKELLTRTLAGVLGVEAKTLETVTVAEGGGSAVVSAFVKVTNITGEDAADRFAGKVNTDIGQGVGGVLYREGFPPSTVVTEVMVAHDECGGVAICEDNQQLCVDLTPYAGYANDWVCQCKPPLVGDAVLHVAVCRDPAQDKVTVTVIVLADAIQNSPLYSNMTEPLEAWAGRVAEYLEADVGDVTARLVGETTAEGIAVEVGFVDEGLKAAFVALAGSCGGGGHFCESLGVRSLLTVEVPCSELLQQDGCLEKPGCTWSPTTKCTPATPPPSDDTNAAPTILAVIISLVGLVLVLLCVLVWCILRRKRADDPPTVMNTSSPGPVGSPQGGEYVYIAPTDYANPLGEGVDVLAAVGSAATQRHTQSVVSEESLVEPYEATPPTPHLATFHENKPMPPVPPLRRASFTFGANNNPLAKPLPGLPEEPPPVYSHPQSQWGPPPLQKTSHRHVDVQPSLELPDPPVMRAGSGVF